MYRVSVTKLESFRRYLVNEKYEEQLIQTIKGIYKGNGYTVVGSAFHKILENPFDQSICFYLGKDAEYIKVGKMAIPITSATIGKKFHDAHPNMMHEQKVQKVYEVNSGKVLVTGRLDGLEGDINHDFKLKFKPQASRSDYERSCQWQFYTDITGCKEFKYQVFTVEGFKDFNIERLEYEVVELNGLVINEPKTFTFCAYSGMQSYLIKLLDSFLEYVAFRGLEPYMKEVNDSDYEQCEVCA